MLLLFYTSPPGYTEFGLFKIYLWLHPDSLLFLHWGSQCSQVCACMCMYVCLHTHVPK